MPYRIYEQLGREDMKKVNRGTTMINHTQTVAIGILTNVLCQVGVTILIAKFLILDIPIDHDSPIVGGGGFMRMIGGIVNTQERLFSNFDGFCHQTFRAARSDTMKTHNDEAESSRSKHPRQHETVEEVVLPQVHHEFLLWEGCSRDAKSRYNTRLAQLLPRHIYSPCVVNWDVLNRMGCDGEIDDMLRIRLREAGLNGEIFTLVAWIRAFNFNESIYAKIFHEFYSTYEFDEVCADDELQTKKIIKFRLGGRAHSLTLLEFARRLELYQVVEIEEEGFNVYFKGGLRTDEDFNAYDYWLSISPEKNLGLSGSHTFTIRNPILRIARKCRVLTEDVLRSLSALIYFRDLDTITLRDLIDSEEYRQSYLWDKYQGVFEHMVEVYSVLLQGAYNPPGYAQSQYDQYYQQYPPPPLQYQQQQQDDDE
ncbi:hypothetical protein Tco_1055663 [Tanacetum coccineum]|uniref:Uncharacterized protein n=1 Tax=Tanacetum coccineum TaxID=301880 RepID=A0ABQ5H0A5_9ASTR